MSLREDGKIAQKEFFAPGGGERERSTENPEKGKMKGGRLSNQPQQKERDDRAHFEVGVKELWSGVGSMKRERQLRREGGNLLSLREVLRRQSGGLGAEGKG